MVESKYTHVKVNNEIELCEVYDKETKEKIKKAFFGAGLSFFIKFKKAAPGREGRFIICVNSSQRPYSGRCPARRNAFVFLTVQIL